MNIGEIGEKFKSTEKVVFGSNRTFLDFDLLIVDLDRIVGSASEYTVNTIAKRQSAFIEFIKHVKVPIIIIAPSIKGYNYLGNFFNSSHLVFSDFTIENETGRRIEVVNNTPFTDFFKKYQDCFSYSSYFTKIDGVITAKTPLSGRTLAFYNSKFILLPKFDAGSQHVEFLNDLYKIAYSINKYEVSYELPDWAKKYQLPDEELLIDKLNYLQQEIFEKEQQLKVFKEEIELFNVKKELFTGTGDGLERQVASLMTDIGFTILESEISRDDLIIQYGDRIAVVEIKGVTGSAAEKYAAQLEKWVSTYFEVNEVHAKGILVVNAYRDKELSERGDTFPHQMLSWSIKREHCLISTIQLIGLYYQVIKYPEQKENLIESLFSTIGVYQGFDDWTSFITHKI